MTTKLSTNRHSSSPHISAKNNVALKSDAPIDIMIDATLIDATLALYAKAEPEPGLESRVAARIVRSQRESAHTRSVARPLVWKRLSMGALATAGACGIVIGTVQHSRHDLPPQAVRSATGTSIGISAAGSAHTPTHAMPASALIDPNSPRNPAHGRAQISRNPNHHPNGIATPAPPTHPTDKRTRRRNHSNSCK